MTMASRIVVMQDGFVQQIGCQLIFTIIHAICLLLPLWITINELPRAKIEGNHIVFGRFEKKEKKKLKKKSLQNLKKLKSLLRNVALEIYSKKEDDKVVPEKLMNLKLQL